MINRREKEKTQREEEIITAALNLFIKKGFNNVSMDAIAAESDFTKRTLYKYFNSKEDLYFGVALKSFKKMFSYFAEAAKKGKTGYEKLILACNAYYQFYKDNPEQLRLMNTIGILRKKDTPKKREWLNFDNSLFKSIESLFEMGKKDNSIHKDVDSVKGAYSFAFLMTGFFNQFSETGKTFTENFKLNQDEFVSYVIELLGRSIKK